MKLFSKRFLFWPTLALLIFFFFQNFRITGLGGLKLAVRPSQPTAEVPDGHYASVEQTELDGLTLAEKFSLVRPKVTGQLSPSEDAFSLASAKSIPPIRVGTWNINGLYTAKINDRNVSEVLIRVLRAYDVVAVQGLDGVDTTALPEVVRRMNLAGRKFDVMMGPSMGRGPTKECLAFVFDSERVETDRYQLYSVEDPQDLLATEPLVGWFRVVGLPHNVSFTFSLINVRFRQQAAAEEVLLLPEILRSVMQDGRNEDDCIVLGDFGVPSRQLGFLVQSGLRPAVGTPIAMTDGNESNDVILMPSAATTEFTGKSGVQDFLREANLSLDQAMEVSDHLPIWAEYWPVEGGSPANKPSL